MYYWDWQEDEYDPPKNMTQNAEEGYYDSEIKAE